MNCFQRKQTCLRHLLLMRIVVQGVEDIWNNIYSQLRKQNTTFKWFFLALGELGDVTDTAQLFS